MSSSLMVADDNSMPTVDDAVDAWLERIGRGANPSAAATALGYPDGVLRDALQERTGAALVIMSAQALAGAERLQNEALAIADGLDDAGWVEIPADAESGSEGDLGGSGGILRVRDLKRDALRIKTRLAIADSRMRIAVRMNSGSVRQNGIGASAYMPGNCHPGDNSGSNPDNRQGDLVTLLHRALQQADLARRRDDAVDAVQTAREDRA